MEFNLENSLSINKIGYKIYYSFNCDKCNSIFKVEKNNLYRRKTKSCQKCSSYLGLEKINIKHPMQHVYSKLLNSAKKKEIFIDIKFEDFLKFTEIINCTYCLKFIDWTSVNRYNLDRKINSLGYTFNNLVVCCWECNNTKSNRYTHEEFLLLSEGLQKIQKLRNN